MGTNSEMGIEEVGTMFVNESYNAPSLMVEEEQKCYGEK